MADMVLNILTLAGLSYLGLGVAAADAGVGRHRGRGAAYLRSAWWISTFSGLTIVLAGRRASASSATVSPTASAATSGSRCERLLALKA